MRERRHKVLIVDDTLTNVRVLKELLKGNYELSVALSGQEALDQAMGDNTPDLVLLDIMMPEMDGLEVCRRLKANARTADIPIIFVTAKNEVEDEAQGFELGAVDFISKPISPPLVLARVRSALKLKENTERLETISDQLSRYLSPQIYESIFKGDKIAHIESSRKKLTIFFSDIVGFTETTERMEAEEMTELLNSYLDAMAVIAFKHGGTVDKFMGDAIMVFFGDPVSQGAKKDALSCVLMALEMRTKVRELARQWYGHGIETPFHARAGVNTGYCTVGNIGSKTKMDYTILGGQVNITSRLEASSEANEILISHETWGLVKDKVCCVKKKPISVKGIPHPIQSYKVIDLHENIIRSLIDPNEKIEESYQQVNLETPLQDLVDTALGRPGEKIYEPLIVMEADKALGVITIAFLLKRLAELGQQGLSGDCS